MNPKRVSPEALQSGAGTVIPGVGGMTPPPITRPPKKVSQETCAVCAEGQGMCACPPGGAMMRTPGGATMAGARYVGSEILSAPVVGARSRPMKAGMREGAEAEPMLTTPGGIAMTPMVATQSLLPFTTFSRFHPTVVHEQTQPLITAKGTEIIRFERPALAVAVPRDDQEKVIEQMKSSLTEMDQPSYSKFLKTFTNKVDDWADKQQKDKGNTNLAFIALKAAGKALALAEINQGQADSDIRRKSVDQVGDAVSKVGVLKDIVAIGTLLELAADQLIPLPNVLGLAKLGMKVGSKIAKAKALKEALEGLEKIFHAADELTDQAEKLSKLKEGLEKVKELEEKGFEDFKKE